MIVIFLIVGLFSQKISFSSDSYKKLDDGSILLKGHVSLDFNNANLKADTVNFTPKTSDFTATGHAVYTKEDGTKVEGKVLAGNFKEKSFSGDKLKYSGKTGYFTGDTIKVKKVGEEKEIEISHGSYTSCCNDIPDWEIWGSHIDAKTEDYAYITNAVFKIKKVPFFYLPYMIFPTKTKRQSGILFPKFYFGTDGFGIGLPLYITLGRSNDITITPGIIEKRHYNVDFELRSVFSKKSWQTVHGFYIWDKLYGGDRYYFSVKNFFKLTKKSYIYGNFETISDLYVPRDFPFIVSNSYEPSIDNKLIFAYNNKDFFWGTMTNIARNLIDDGYVKRLPEFRVFYNKTYGPFVSNFEFAMDYISYNSDTDLFTSFKPTIYMPYNIYGVDITPKLNLSFSSLNYRHSNNSATKQYFDYDFSLNINSTYYKNFGSLYHSVEPFVEYHVRKHHDDLLNIYDFYDSLFNVSSSHYIVYGFRTRLQDKVSFFFEAKDIYDLTELERQYSLFQAYGTIWLFILNSSLKIPSYTDLSNSVTNLGLRFGLASNFLGTYYTYSKDTTKQETFYGQLDFGTIRLYSRLVYDYLDSTVKEKLYRVHLAPNSKCWAFELEARDTFEKPDVDYRIMFSLVFAGKTYGLEH